MNLRIAQKGLLHFRIDAHGKEAHSATPESGVNAIELLIDALERLRRIDLAADRLLGPSTMNIGVIEGGSAANVVPGHSSATVSFRLVRGDEDLYERIKAEFSDDLRFELYCNYPPCIVRDDALIGHLQNLLAELEISNAVISMPGFTGMHFWSTKGPAIVIGPGNYHTEHTSEEYITAGDLESGYRFYLSVLRSFPFK